ncbi:DNA/RNA non-specific endonuclease [Cellulomonas sp. URHB0016]
MQTRIGGEGGVGYDGGHLFAKMFGGGGEDINIVPMLDEVNRAGTGSFYELEQQWRSLIGQMPPVDVSVRIEPEYVGASRVPDHFVVLWSENGVWKDREFDNVAS